MQRPRRSGLPPTRPTGQTGPARSGQRWGPSIGYIVLAVALVAGSLAYGLMSAQSPGADAAAGTVPPVVPLVTQHTTQADARAAGAAPRSAAPLAATPARVAATSTQRSAPAGATPQVQRIRDPNGDTTPDLADFVNPGELPTMREVIERLHLAGVHSGLGAFSPPGTRPPLIGLAVPKDFVLPEGYVRHHQATDDGQNIEPILMFSPDFRFVDGAGQPIALPADRVVPPTLAPPGLPIRQIVIPAPAQTGRPGR
jgi:hypothetical protein